MNVLVDCKKIELESLFCHDFCKDVTFLNSLNFGVSSVFPLSIDVWAIN